MLLKPFHLSRCLNLHGFKIELTTARNLLTLTNPPRTRIKNTIPLACLENSTTTIHSGSRYYAQLSQSLLLPLNAKSKSKSASLTTTGASSASNTEVRVKKRGRNPLANFMELPQDGNSGLQSLKVDTEWRTVYRFSHIRVARVVQRLKLYQTAFTCFFAVPTSLGLYFYGAAEPELVVVTAAICGLACTMLYVMGSFFSRLIGVIYVTDKDPEIVRVAHMTFWGTRKDDIFAKTEFVPFSELPDNIRDVYIHIKTYSDPDDKLYLSLQYGEIHDRFEFENIFGQIPDVVTKSSK